MSLKKLSFISLTLLGLNSYAMQEPTEKPVGDTNERSSQEQTSKQAPAKNQEIQTLKYDCAKHILINQPGIIEELNIDEEFAKNVPMELQDYLKYVQKKEELNKHELVPIFKKYLEQCFDNLSLDQLQEILSILDKAPSATSTIMQRLIPNMSKSLFCDDYLTKIILVLPSYCNDIAFIAGLKKTRINHIKNALSCLNNDNELAHKKLNLALAILDDNVAKIRELAFNNYIDAIGQLSLLQCQADPNLFATFFWANRLIQKDALDYVSDLIILKLSILHKSRNEILEVKDFYYEFFNNLIMLLTDENKYKSEYDLCLALMYAFLNDNSNTKKYAEKYLNDNEGILFMPLLTILMDIYTEEGETEKAEFYANLLAKETAFIQANNNQ